jgi:hypothetical protein
MFAGVLSTSCVSCCMFHVWESGVYLLVSGWLTGQVGQQGSPLHPQEDQIDGTWSLLLIAFLLEAVSFVVQLCSSVPLCKTRWSSRAVTLTVI